jgi:hypothetical protein
MGAARPRLLDRRRRAARDYRYRAQAEKAAPERRAAAIRGAINEEVGDLKPLEKPLKMAVRAQNAHLAPVGRQLLVEADQGAKPRRVYVRGLRHIYYDVARFLGQTLKHRLCALGKGVIEPARDLNICCHHFYGLSWGFSGVALLLRL